MSVCLPASNELSSPLQHVAAVLARKRMEDEQKAKKLQQKAKKLQQIVEERRMAKELQRQRMEKEVKQEISSMNMQSY